MKLTIESTPDLVTLDGVDVRVWKGVTESGEDCLVFVHLIRAADGHHMEFEKELIVMRRPKGYGES